MKRTHLTSLAAAALLAAGTGLALAHGDGTYNKDSGSDGRAHHGHHGSFFERIDSDKSGSISLSEAQAAAKMHLARFDSDGDGTITSAEIEAHAQERFAMTDLDSNGEVTREEAREARKSWRERMHDQ